MHEGLRKAALLLKNMPEDQREPVLAHLSDVERDIVLAEMRGLPEPNDGPLFASLERWPPEALASFLQQQHPQLSLTILRELPPATSEAAFKTFLPAYRMEVLKRLRFERRPTDDVLRLIDEAVRREYVR